MEYMTGKVKVVKHAVSSHMFHVPACCLRCIPWCNVKVKHSSSYIICTMPFMVPVIYWSALVKAMGAKGARFHVAVLK